MYLAYPGPCSCTLVLYWARSLTAELTMGMELGRRWEGPGEELKYVKIVRNTLKYVKIIFKHILVYSLLVTFFKKS